MVCLDTTFLKTICLASGPSGNESEVLRLIEAKVAPLCDRIVWDALGNLLCFYDGDGTCADTLLCSAHADEVGFMITELCEDGLLRFCEVGGYDERILCGKPVTVGFGERRYRGTICAKPIHLQARSERKKVPSVSDLRIDVGAKSKEEAAELIKIGDYAVFESNIVSYGNHAIKAKALDDRLGCAILTDVLQTLHENKIRPSHNLCFAFTVREEVGLSGAVVAANRVAPKWAVVLETTAIADLQNVPDYRQVATQGKGGALSIMDRSTVYHREMLRFVQDLAQEKDIPVQVKKYVSGGNDAAHIHKSRAGVATLALSAPCRYLHSPACVIDTRDADAMANLLFAIATSPALPKEKEVIL